MENKYANEYEYDSTSRVKRKKMGINCLSISQSLELMRKVCGACSMRELRLKRNIDTWENMENFIRAKGRK